MHDSVFCRVDGITDYLISLPNFLSCSAIADNGSYLPLVKRANAEILCGDAVETIVIPTQMRQTVTWL